MSNTNERESDQAEGEVGVVTADLVITESPFTRYLAALLPAAILIIGALQPVLDNPTDWTIIVQFALLVIGTAVAYGLKLLPSGWQGAAKTGAQIVTVILTALVPFLLPGGFDPAVNWTLIIVGVLNAVATEFGVQIRKDAYRLAA
jgi:hypothetical protein